MSHFEYRLNQRFWRSKKVVQVAQIGRRGGGGNLDKIQKKSNLFSGNFPYEGRLENIAKACESNTLARATF